MSSSRPIASPMCGTFAYSFHVAGPSHAARVAWPSSCVMPEAVFAAGSSARKASTPFAQPSLLPVLLLPQPATTSATTNTASTPITRKSSPCDRTIFSFSTRPHTLLTPDAVAVAVKAVNVRTRNPNWSVDVARSIAGATRAVHVGTRRNAGVVPGRAVVRAQSPTMRGRVRGGAVGFGAGLVAVGVVGFGFGFEVCRRGCNVTRRSGSVVATAWAVVVVTPSAFADGFEDGTASRKYRQPKARRERCTSPTRVPAFRPRHRIWVSPENCLPGATTARSKRSATVKGQSCGTTSQGPCVAPIGAADVWRNARYRLCP